MPDALIPIGSVVRLEGQDWLAVILGFYPDNGERMFDYLAAPYPSGLFAHDAAMFVDADAIVDVVSRGYQDERSEEALGAVAEYMSAREEAHRELGRELERQDMTPLEGVGPAAGETSFHMD